MNTSTQINTDDFINYANQYITYDISEFCSLDEDAYHCVASAIDQALKIASQQKEYFIDRNDIEVCENRQIAFVDFSIESIDPILETVLEEQIRSTMRHLDYFSDSLDCYVTATAICVS
jgi:hypothetical protein